MALLFLQLIVCVCVYTHTHTHKYIYIYIYIHTHILLFRATLVAYGSSQVRCPIGAAAAGLCHSHSSTRSKLHLLPTPHLSQSQNLNPLSKARDQTHIIRILARFISTEPQGELLINILSLFCSFLLLS